MPVLLFSWQVNKQQKISTVTTKTSVSAWNFTLGAAREKLFVNLFDRLDKKFYPSDWIARPFIVVPHFFFLQTKKQRESEVSS